ncbi:DNA-(apurinic or apyrimidinic site) lyase [Strongyloides ratti]|uniref:exodeoxyribonuclease III n=1 Tax=Strongyloides ratti TaxID=34506 RepID=A0A090MY83_STRRB|nr:DNA-(apurinic or apyrimidinic site) lyase [Strongyloides ratti]CEF66734.1 DNA-(apurinic or apyrimidinic site) lyase [Strongyloides ratti]
MYSFCKKRIRRRRKKSLSSNSNSFNQNFSEQIKKEMSKRKVVSEGSKLFPIFDNAKKSKATTSFRKYANPENKLRICSWNVASLKAIIKKDGISAIKGLDADIMFLQETKCTELPKEINDIEMFGFKRLYPATVKKGGYSGICMLAREAPSSVVLGIGNKEFDSEGRIITAEYPDFYVVGVYVPNSGAELVNLSKRKVWEDLLLEKLKNLDEKKPVIYVGDLNVAHQAIDLAKPDSNYNKTAGYTQQEIDDFSRLLNSGFVDVYRKLFPDETGAYTYYSYRFNCRAKGIGWRLDYFVISERIFDRVEECKIFKNIEGSDHCPISLTIDL